MTLTVDVLGCDGSYPGPGGAGSGYLVRCRGTSVLLDAGPGTLARLQERLPLEDLDAVVVTHEHVDHWSDLEHAAVAIRYVLPRPALPLYCEADIPSMTRSGPAASALDRHPIAPGSTVVIGALAFSFHRTDHPVETLAVRVEGAGRSLGYSADTGPGWELAELGPGLDLALCEATYLSDMEGPLPHLSARQAGLTARRAGVRRLVITHLWPRTDRAAAVAEASQAFGGPVELAVTGARFEI